MRKFLALVLICGIFACGIPLTSLAESVPYEYTGAWTGYSLSEEQAILVHNVAIGPRMTGFYWPSVSESASEEYFNATFAYDGDNIVASLEHQYQEKQDFTFKVIPRGEKVFLVGEDGVIYTHLEGSEGLEFAEPETESVSTGTSEPTIAPSPSVVNTTEATSAPTTFTDLSVGSEGDAVVQLQEYLIALGYLTGGADGIYGNGTADAVKKFQKNMGVEETGIADSNTQNLLFSQKLPPKQDISVESIKMGSDSIGTSELSVVFKNNLSTTVDRLDFYVMCLDTYGEIMQAYNAYGVTSLSFDYNIESGEKTSDNWRWKLYGLGSINTVMVSVYKYHTVDGQTVEIPDDELFWFSYTIPR